MLNIAHRGFSARYPENTTLAFEKALELGVGWIETDVRQTRDGHFVILHDATVDRTTDGKGPVAELTLAEVQALDAGAWRGRNFAGERVPALADVLDRFGSRAGLVLEVKFPGEAPFPQFLEEVRRGAGSREIVLSTFDLPRIPSLKRLAPDLPVTALLRLEQVSPDEAIRRVLDLGADTIGPRASEVTGDFVEQAHGAGLQVRTWGLGDDRGELMRHLIACGVDGTTTDHPDALRDILSA